MIPLMMEYDDFARVLESAPDDCLQGRTVVNLTTGTPAGAKDMDARVKARGGEYLEGHIPIYPQVHRPPDAKVTFSGPAKLWERYGDLLRSLGRESVYLGEDLGSASYFAAASSAFFHIGVVAFLESVRNAQDGNQPLDRLLELCQ